MGLKKGHTNNPNGRPKGSPNKVTTEMKEWLTGLLIGDRKAFEKNLREVDAEKQLVIYERLLQYILPKQQSISVEAQIAAEYEELEKLLSTAPEEAIERILTRIEELKNLSNER